MAKAETDTGRPGPEAAIIEALASALDIAIMIFDRSDTLVAASQELRRFFDVPQELLSPGARLRDLLGAVFDSGGSVLGAVNGKARHVTREDWIAERIAIHWRERYESVEKLADGRWVCLHKRRMPDGILVATIADISEQKRRDTELSKIRRQSELAQHILDNLVNPVVVKDSALRYVIVNEAFCRIPGLQAQHVIGRVASELVAPDLAARFEVIEKGVLESGVPFEAIEDIFRSDGTVMHAITRVRRSGTPGNYYVTVSFDDVSPFAASKKYKPNVTSHYDIDAPLVEGMDDRRCATGGPSEPQGRVLVLDEDSQRSALRVAALKLTGSDAIAISVAAEVVTFLDAARSMGVAIDDVEMTGNFAKALQNTPELDRHPMVKQAVESGPVVDPPLVQTTPDDASPENKSSPRSAAPAVSAPPLAAAPQSPVVPQVSQPVRAGRDRIRVLVAEDNDVNQIVFEQILEGLGVEYRIVGNGEEAVAAWRAAPPDLILMDISMPGMNGLQATEAIRNAESGRVDEQPHVPIIAVTAHAMNGDRERCFAAGMDDYLSKPVSPEKLEAMIRTWIDCSESALAVD